VQDPTLIEITGRWLHAYAGQNETKFSAPQNSQNWGVCRLYKSSQVYFTKSQCAVGNSDKTNVQSSKSTVPLATT